MELEPLLQSLQFKEKVNETAQTIKTLSVGQAQQLAKQILQNEELVNAIVDHLQRIHEGSGSAEDPLCMWFYEWYQVEEPNSEPILKRFVLSFVPVLLWLCIYNVQSQRKTLVGVEAVLLSIYNKELLRRDNKEVKWTPPTISSIRTIKKTGASTPSMLTEKYLKGLDSDTSDKGVVLEEALPIITDSIARDREYVIRVALQQYLAHVAFMPVYSVISFCVVATKLSVSGYPFDIVNIDKQEPENEDKKVARLHLQIPKPIRIQLSAVNFNYLVDGITFALFKPQTKALAKTALEAISSRASYDLIPQIMLSTNSLKHIMEKEKEYPILQ